MDLLHQFVSFFFARYPCHYGACYQTDRTRRSTWVKGPDRTVEGVTAMQERWRRETGGDRERLKDYENVELEPLVPALIISMFSHWSGGTLNNVFPIVLITLVLPRRPGSRTAPR